MTTAGTTANARLTYVWLVLCAITLAAWWLAPAHPQGHYGSSTPITITILAMGFVKTCLVIRHFMEVRTAPRWLQLFTGIWLVVMWGAVLAIYLF